MAKEDLPRAGCSVIKAARILRARAAEFAGLITLEMGKLIAESLGEVALSADIIDYYAERAEGFLAPQTLTPHSGAATIENTPIGVLFGIEPWNFRTISWRASWLRI